MYLYSLPNEILLEIISYLSKFHLVALSQTFNKALTYICLNAIDELPWRKMHQNEQRMIAHFGPCTSRHTRDPTAGVYPSDLGMLLTQSSDPVDRLDMVGHLHISDDLSWLAPLDDHSAEKAKGLDRYARKPAASSQQLRALGDACARLGLTPPKCFLGFMRSVQLQRRITSLNYAWMVGPLVKLISVENELVDGYGCAFYMDPAGGGVGIRRCLYMDRRGGECVLCVDWLDFPYQFGWFDNYPVLARQRRQRLTAARTPVEEALDMAVWVFEDFQSMLGLDTTTFEEFLVNTYFDEWASVFKWSPVGDGEMPAVLKAWMQR